ncbi:MAG: protein kinase [Myxococcales bacterium]|nr:protein kinase [Myxococcales bacterium]
MTEGPGPGAGAGTERRLGRYAIFDEIASGGMATVHLGRMLGPVGFSKTVAIKCLHPHLARDPDFVSMFLDEARLAARIQHPNVVATLDVVTAEGEVFLVLDYLQGESFSHLLKATRIKGVPVAPRVLASVLVNTLHGLHAAHEATDEHGRPLGIVHRDVSPQNILVGVDGVARVLDFGVAKAAGRLQNTRDGQLKGKLAYMAPEQIRGDPVDRRTDIYAAAAVFWEGLAGRRLIHGLNEGQVLAAVLAGNFPPPSSIHPGTPPEVDALVMRGLAMDPNQRWPTARELAISIEQAVGVASPYEVAEWVQSVSAETLAIRAARVREMESTSAVRVSLHEASGPQIFHDPPRFDASRSGVTQSSVSSPGPPVPPPVGIGESSVSFALHPDLIPSAPGHPQPSTTRAPLEAPPLYSGQAGLPPMQGYTAPAAAAPPSKLKVILASVLVSLVFGLSVIMLLFWVRARTRPVESGIEGDPVNPTTGTNATATPSPEPPRPAPAAVESAATPDGVPIVDIPTAKADEPGHKQPAAPPNKSDDKPVADKPRTDKPSADKPVADSPKPNVTTKPPTTPTAKPPKGCDSPFYVDSAGIKHIKPECM